MGAGQDAVAGINQSINQSIKSIEGALVAELLQG